MKKNTNTMRPLHESSLKNLDATPRECVLETIDDYDRHFDAIVEVEALETVVAARDLEGESVLSLLFCEAGEEGRDTVYEVVVKGEGRNRDTALLHKYNFLNGELETRTDYDSVWIERWRSNIGFEIVKGAMKNGRPYECEGKLHRNGMEELKERAKRYGAVPVKGLEKRGYFYFNPNEYHDFS